MRAPPFGKSRRARFPARALVVAVACGLFVGCSSDAEPSVETSPESWAFVSDFDQAGTLVDLFPADLRGWTNVQCVEPDGSQSSSPSGMSVVSGSNSIGLDSSRSVSGSRSVRMEAPPSGAKVSKAAIAKQGVDFRPGDRITAQFRLFLEDNGSAENLFLMDFESMEISGYPGRRLAVSSAQELFFESKNAGGAFGSGSNFRQDPTSRAPLIKGRWVAIRLELDLSREDQGGVRIWQDGALVLEARGRTFPTEPEITRYDWVEFGITANSSPGSQRLWLDDVSLSRARSW